MWNLNESACLALLDILISSWEKKESSSWLRVQSTPPLEQSTHIVNTLSCLVSQPPCRITIYNCVNIAWLWLSESFLTGVPHLPHQSHLIWANIIQKNQMYAQSEKKNTWRVAQFKFIIFKIKFFDLVNISDKICRINEVISMSIGRGLVACQVFFSRTRVIKSSD